MFIRLLRFWRGTMHFSVCGKNIERFLNLCSRAHIVLWDGKRTEQSYEANALKRHEKQLKAFAEKAQLDWELFDIYGAAKLGKLYKKRSGFIIGTVLCIFVFILSQQLVWRIEVRGNEEVSASSIVKTLNELGLKKGSIKAGLDVIRLADELTLNYENISWVGINLVGTVAEVEIVERVMPPNLLDETDSCNVVAGKAGQLVELEVYDGKRMVKTGDTVREGQLIASGIITDKKGRNIYRHARAKAMIEYTEEEVIAVPLKIRELIVSGDHFNTYRIGVGKYSIPISFDTLFNSSGFSTEEGLVESGVFKSTEGQQWFYSVRNRRILGPVFMQIQQYIPAEETVLSYSINQAKKLAVLELNKLQTKLEGQDIEIVSRTADFSVKNNVLYMEATLSCREDVAKEVLIHHSES